MSADRGPDVDWLGVRLPGWSSPVSGGVVRTHAAGKSALDSFAQALRRCVNSKAIVLVSAWSFSNVPTSSGYTHQLLTEASAKGARIRVLFARFPTWKWPGREPYFFGGTPDNRENVAFISRLANGSAILDGWALHHVFDIWGLRSLGRVQIGIHHMKAWVIYDGSRLTGWIGGVDLNSNRTPDQDPNYWHDVQAELEGPPAGHLYDLLRARWNNHPAAPPASLLPPIAEQSSGAAAPQRVRIVTTFGNPAAHAGLGPPGWSIRKAKGYPFAPAGSRSYRSMVLHCIELARRFIYIEDQYLVEEDIGKRLGAAMPHLAAVIILIPCTDGRKIPETEQHPDGLKGEVLGVSGELHQAWERRRRFLDHLAPHRHKVAVVTRDRYVHAKLWIFDDTVAIVGSANINRRGFGHDTEGGVAFQDVPPATAVSGLRVDLWQRHLGASAPSPSTPAEQALGIWQAPPASTKVAPYSPSAGRDKSPAGGLPSPLKNWFWDSIVDPL